jgi:phosphatidylglycerophosphatase A
VKMTTRIAVFFATGFGLGWSPVASGTFGSLPGVGIVLLVWPAPWPLQALLALATSLCAIPLCDAAERHFGKKDDHRIVADEYLTFPICMIGLPLIPWVLGLAFLTNRFFDIIKPPPARGLQSLNGGLGIVSDDVFSSLYSLALNHGLYWLISRWLSM